MTHPIDFSTATLSNIVAADVLAEIQLMAQEVHIAKGDLIERRNDPATHITLIRSGLIRLGIDGIDGSRYNMSLLGAGNTFGETSLFLKEPVRHDAHAETDAVLDRLSLAAVNELMTHHPTFGQALLTVAYSRFRSLLDYVGDAKKQSLEIRTAKIISDISKSSTDNSDDKKVVECRQVDLAHALNVSRVSIGKALKALDSKQLITLGYRKITILSETKLTEFIKTYAKF